MHFDPEIEPLREIPDKGKPLTLVVRRGNRPPSQAAPFFQAGGALERAPLGPGSSAMGPPNEKGVLGDPR